MKVIYTIKRKLYAILADGTGVSYQQLGMNTSGNAGSSIGSGGTANTNGTLGTAKATTSKLGKMTTEQRQAKIAEIRAKKNNITQNASNIVNNNAIEAETRNIRRDFNTASHDQLSNLGKQKTLARQSGNTQAMDAAQKGITNITNRNQAAAATTASMYTPRVSGNNAFMNHSTYNPNRLKVNNGFNFMNGMGRTGRFLVGAGAIAGSALAANHFLGKWKKKKEDD